MRYTSTAAHEDFYTLASQSLQSAVICFIAFPQRLAQTTHLSSTKSRDVYPSDPTKEDFSIRVLQIKGKNQAVSIVKLISLRWRRWWDVHDRSVWGLLDTAQNCFLVEAKRNRAERDPVANLLYSSRRKCLAKRSGILRLTRGGRKYMETIFCIRMRPCPAILSLSHSFCPPKSQITWVGGMGVGVSSMGHKGPSSTAPRETEICHETQNIQCKTV